MPDRQLSAKLFKAAKEVIPGGVNSPVRAFRNVNGDPFFVQRARGCRIWDVDGNEMIDYVGTWGPAILGHAPSAVIEVVHHASKEGLSFGIHNRHEVEMARMIRDYVHSVEKVRMVNSGTEATMSAIRLARGYTGRDKIVKFEGCYHGHVDSLLVAAGSGALTFGQPDSAGVPADLAKLTLTVPFNRPEIIEEVFEKHGHEIAALIVEPITANAGMIFPKEGFLQLLRDLTTKHGTVLIFDEVMTGFRLARGGVQELVGITPDLTAMGKVIGGGLPVGAFGGKTEIMDLIAPLGGVYQAGTLAGSPLAVAAGLAMLNVISKPGFHDELAARTTTLLSGLQERADQAGIAFTTNQVGAMFGCFFTEEKQVSHFSQVMSCDTERFKHYFHHMLDNGVYLAPSAFEAGFVSSAHGDKEIQLTLDAAEKAFAALPK